AAGAGAHALQRPDGKFLIVRGNATTGTDIYDPVANTVSAGPVLGGAAGAGAHALQRADGKFLIVRGNNTTSTFIYDPVANTVSAGPVLGGAAGAGAHALQRPDGKFLIIRGNNTTGTDIYDAGWFVSGQYISEKLSPSGIVQWNLIGWTKTADNTVAFSVRTASTDTGLDSASYRSVTNGGSIGAGAGEIWLQVKADFSRTIPSYTGADINVWGGEGHTFYQRTFARPDVQDITLNYTPGPKPPLSLTQYKADGASVIPTGAYADGTAVVMKLSMSSGLGSDTLTPRVEVRPLGTSFTNSPTHSGTALAYSGSPLTGSVTVTGLVQGTDYHWQARVAGTTGNSPWVSYGGNLETAMDFGTPTTVSIGKSVTPSSGNAGVVATYTITISNTGAGVAKVTAITDTLPADFAYVNNSTGGTTTANPSITGQTLAWILSRDVTTATPITLSFRATASTIGGTYYDNASVQGANFLTTSSGDTAPVTVLVPGVSVAKTASPSQVVPREQVTYTITVNSIGNTTAAPSSIVDNLPAGSGFSYLLGSTTGGITADPKVTGGLTLTWDTVPTIPPGGSLVFSFRVVTGTSSAQFYNSVTASGNFPQVSTGNTAPVFVGAAMLVSKTANPSIVPAATNVTYTITISNGSVGTDAGLTTVEDNLPGGFSYVNNSTTGAITANPQITGQTNLKWQGPWTVPGGGSFTFSFQATVTLDWGTYYDSVTIQGTNFLPVSTGPTAGVTTVGWIQVSKTVDNPTPGASEVVTYTVTAQNVGPSDVPVSKFTDTIPTTFIYVAGSTSGAVSGDPSIVGNTMTWSGAQIPASISAGTTISFSFRTMVSSSADTYYDVARAYVSWLDKNYTISTGDTAPVTVVTQPSIAISETYGD
ncbi:MAG: hypothetical protein Q8O76_02845, partial [Chloroflexota bacterium]|nr:hypothetical protein [Chloroflexota bacterium]